MARSRERSSVAVSAAGSKTTWIQSSSLGSTNYGKRNFNASYTTDELHPIWNLKDGSGTRNPYVQGADVGGVFDSLSVIHDTPVVRAELASVDRSFIWDSYSGDLCAYHLFSVPDNETTPMGPSQIVSNLPLPVQPLGERIVLGGSAISRAAPARPEAGLTVSLIELVRDGVPSILSQTAKLRHDPRSLEANASAFRGMGKDYLNLEFGWKPFVADIRAMAQAVVNQERILADLTRNSGRRVRRRYEFAPVTTSTEDYDSFKPWPLQGSNLLVQASHRRSTSTTRRTWFAGEFIYRVPKLDGIGGVGAKARHLLGLDLTPSTLWNAAPWTWLADWQSNAGDVLANISAMSADDLVMRYGYLMQASEYKVTSTHSGLSPAGGVSGSLPSTLSSTVTYSWKTRIRASPFGFGLTTEDFTPRQWAVLAALGISRGR